MRLSVSWSLEVTAAKIKEKYGDSVVITNIRLSTLHPVSFS